MGKSKGRSNPPSGMSSKGFKSGKSPGKGPTGHKSGPKVTKGGTTSTAK